MKPFLILILLSLLHTWPYWNTSENLVGRPGDPFAHAAIGEWYCKNVVPANYQFEGYMAPYGVNVAGNYDSPFPFILTCPALKLGPQAQFHLFSYLQILLILLSSWALSGLLVRTQALRWAYVFLTWFCSFYLVRSHIHLTLLSVIWGFQTSLYAVLAYDKKDRRKVLMSFVLLSVSLCGTFQNLTALFLLYVAFAFYLLRNFKTFTAAERKSLLLAGGAGAAVFLFLWGPMISFTLQNAEPVFNGADLREKCSLTLAGLTLPFRTNAIAEHFGFAVGDYEQSNAVDWVVFAIFAFLLFYKKFKLSVLEKTGVVIALIYLYLSFGPSLPGSDIIYELYPFKIGRTPSRYAVITHMLTLVLVFFWLGQMAWSHKVKTIIGASLVLWALLSGPAANQLWFAPTFKYKAYLPEKAFNEIKIHSNPGSTVVMIPSAWAKEPVYNFLRLFHGQNISSAYLAYPVYNVEMVKNFEQDRFLSEVDCGRTVIAFKNGAIMNEPEVLRSYLKEKGYQYTVINKTYLSSTGGCEDLKNWVFKYLKFPWVKILEENNSFLVTQHL